VGVTQTTQVTAEVQSNIQRIFQELERSFRDIHPGVRLEVLVFPEDELVGQVQRRSRSGLGPDLMLVDGDTALELDRQSLSRSLPHPHGVSRNLRPELLPAVTSPTASGHRERLLALPVGLQPQLACYDRRRLQEPPQTLQQLLAASAAGQRFGIHLRLVNLAWSLGATGSLPSVVAITRGEAVTAEQRQALQRWLLWLREAAMQQHISLERSSRTLVEGLRQGHLDWITCRSQDVGRLREHLGEQLGLAPMPDGATHAASPLSTLRVWVLGRNSSDEQRRAAEELVKFTLNPPIQRAFTLHTHGMLPVSQNTPLPLDSSANLTALLGAQQQADEAQSLNSALVGLRDRENQLDQIVTEFHYGHLGLEEATDALIRSLQRRQP
jgi:ABC-type glycerol-3-phosphate transport system substrate-binding protein